MPHADSPTCSMGLIQTRRAGDSASRPALSPACLLLPFCLPWWPTHPHCNSGKEPVLSSLPVIRVAALKDCPVQTREASVLYFLYFCARKPFDEGLCSHCCSAGSVAGLGTGSTNSVVLNGGVGRIGLVIFQAWSVLGG